MKTFLGIIIIVLVSVAIVGCFQRIKLFPKGSLERKLTILCFIAVWSMGAVYAINSQEIYWRIVRIVVGWVSLSAIMWVIYCIPVPLRHEKGDADLKSNHEEVKKGDVPERGRSLLLTQIRRGVNRSQTITLIEFQTA